MKKCSSFFLNEMRISVHIYKLCMLVIFQCAIAYKLSGQPPVINTFTPASGPIGTTVTITGNNFNPIASNNIVYFGAVRAAVMASTASSLNVKVPAGANYQPLTVTTNNLTGYSSKPFNVTFGNNGANFSANSFAPKVDYQTGNYSRVATADLDGDGKADMAVINELSRTLSLYRNTSIIGTLSFAPLFNYSTNLNPTDIAIGDLDGDGKIDLAISNAGSNSVSVFRNTSIPGTISFATKMDFEAGSAPYGISIGDLNGDGKPDIAMTNQSSNTVSIYRNTGTPGTISFAAIQDYTTGSNPLYLSLGDLDGDGKPDLALANSHSNTFSIFRNTSSGGVITFGARIDYSAGILPFGINIGDLDGDGKLDLVVTNYTSNTVSLFKNTSVIGTIGFASAINYATSTSYGITIDDLDGDGKPDLVIGNYGGNSISLFRNISNSGTIAYDAKINYDTYSSPTKIATGDLDGDGKPDIAVPHVGTPMLSVFRNQISVVLPVTLLKFTASPVNQMMHLQWLTISEQNNDGFEVERSINEINSFKKISWLSNKGNGSLNQYDFYDKEVVSRTKYYYRLKQVDKDGNYKYSEVLSAMLNEINNAGIRILPNPADKNLQVLFDQRVLSEQVTITIVDVRGSVVLISKQNIYANSNTSLNVSGLAIGQYFLTISNNKNILFSQVFQKI